MVADSKRETFLPHKLWENKRNGDENERVGSRGILSERGTDKNHSTRFGIPIKPSRTSEALDRSKKQSTTQYHRFYNIDQAGPGVVALKDTENFPVCLIKEPNIGDCLLEKRSFYDRHKDIKAVGSIVVSLSDRTTLLCESSRDADIPPLSEQANSFIERTKAATSVEQLLKVLSLTMDIEEDAHR
ncbi:hypothetical protein NUU61_009359 [Penicillium alfredii]|uniref:Uncharacterized protein n=1 Tax=Penicillium alfredii TaxID=1506179 RepID=A0A9W9JX72_9EURO|nr:uncharacterized protein NUU61_009359 [Penicillium alfredii]KAJ5084780.1 hypothetical protein NUU61_009359 [Penicillium alfredii]